MRSRRSAHALLWLLVVLAAIGLIWLWWAAAKHNPRKASSTHQSAAAQTTSSTNSQTQTRPRTNAPLIVAVAGFPRPAQTFFEAQFALDRLGISSGSLDGKMGSQTHAAIRAYQHDLKL